MTIDIKQELTNLGYYFETEGDDISVTKFSSITEASNNDITFCYYDGNKAIDFIASSNAGIILCKNSIKNNIHPKNTQQFYFLENPRLAFIQLIKSADKDKSKLGISSFAIVQNVSNIGKNCEIGHYTIIDNNSSIGDNCVIGNRVSLKNCVIGDNCLIQSGSSIGEDGFAYERYPSGELEHFPHMGKVVIGNNVDISANCSIARGSMTNTVIGDGTKIDALVHIAHNVKLGRYCEITAGTIIGGSTVVGNSSWTGLNCTLKDNINVGNNVIVAAGAMVINNVIDEDIVAGVPAKSIRNKVNSKNTFLMAGQKGL